MPTTSRRKRISRPASRASDEPKPRHFSHDVKLSRRSIRISDRDKVHTLWPQMHECALDLIRTYVITRELQLNMLVPYIPRTNRPVATALGVAQHECLDHKTTSDCQMARRITKNVQ